MGLFNKQNDNEENKAPRNPSNVVLFRLLAVVYVFYLCIQMIKTYTAGGPEAPSLTMLICCVAALGGGAIFLAVLSYKEWKRNKVIYDQAMADLRAEAEAKRALEEQEEEVELEDEADEFPSEAEESSDESQEISQASEIGEDE